MVSDKNQAWLAATGSTNRRGGLCHVWLGTLSFDTICARSRVRVKVVNAFSLDFIQRCISVYVQNVETEGSILSNKNV